jgi:hypothetical protein
LLEYLEWILIFWVTKTEYWNTLQTFHRQCLQSVHDYRIHLSSRKSLLIHFKPFILKKQQQKKANSWEGVTKTLISFEEGLAKQNKRKKFKIK